MKRFLIKFLLLLLPLLGISFGLEYIVTAGLQKSSYEYYGAWNDIFTGNAQSDIVIMGSSRAFRHISPTILDSALGLRSYNLAIDGHNFFLQWYKLLIYLQHAKLPKFIIQTLDYSTLEKRPDLFDYRQFFPYLKNSLVLTGVQSYEGFSSADLYLPLYRYRAHPKILFTGIMEYFGLSHAARIDDRGYIGVDGPWDGKFERFIEKHPNGITAKLDSSSVSLFYSLGSFCKNNNISLVLVYPPDYIEGQGYITNRREIFSLYQNYADSFKIPFFDYSNDSLSYNKNLFYNVNHLNKTGAELFTRKLAQDIKTTYFSK